MITKNWDKVLKEEYHKEYFIKLRENIHKLYKEKTIFPTYDNIFEAFKLTDYDDIKVVIIGQDPYFNKGQAEGLCFSVKEGVRFPSSLQNIFKELNNDLNIPIPKSGSLRKWAKQGVFLLNTILTVEEGKPLSHKDMGWEIFTDKVIEKINEKESPVVFILWGNNARSKKKFITNKNHYVIESVHPSGLSASRGFFGSKPFSKTNEFLKEKKINQVDFKLD